LTIAVCPKTAAPCSGLVVPSSTFTSAPASSKIWAISVLRQLPGRTSAADCAGNLLSGVGIIGENGFHVIDATEHRRRADVHRPPCARRKSMIGRL